MASPTSAWPVAASDGAHHGPPDTDSLQDLARRSVELIGSLQDGSGAYPASPTFSAYLGYAWLRDGSFTAEAMSRWGEFDSASRFHLWVADVLNARKGRVSAVIAARDAGQEPAEADMLPTRFTLAGGDGQDDWWDYQTDGYGMWLWALSHHLRRHHLAADPWLPAVNLAVDYLCTFGGDACFDWWEEHSEHRHTSTLAAVRAGLLAAAGIPGLTPDRRGRAETAAAALLHTILTEAVSGSGSARYLTKWIGSQAIDASLAGCVVPFGVVPAADPLATATLGKIAADLDVDGGVHRFTEDVFYGGGQWLLLSCLLGWNLAATGDLDAGWRYLRWAAAHTDPSGEMPEQVDDHLLHPEHRQQWIDRWGPVAQPLLWSHAMFLILADELGLQAAKSVL